MTGACRTYIDVLVCMHCSKVGDAVAVFVNASSVLTHLLASAIKELTGSYYVNSSEWNGD